MSENNQSTQDKAPLKKLASAEELRGRRSGTDNSGKPPRKRKLWVPLVALCVVLAAAVRVYLYTQTLKPAEEVATDPAADYVDQTVKLIDSSRSEIASVTVEVTGGDTFTIVNRNTYDENGVKTTPADQVGFVLEGMESFDLDQTKADTILGYGANLTATKMVTENAENLADYGLDVPRATITMTYKNGASTQWLIGAQAPTSTGSYFMEKGKKTVFLLYASAVKNILSTRNSLHVVEMPYTIDPTTVKDVVIEAEGRDTIELLYTMEDDKFSSYSVSSVRILQPFFYCAHAERCEEFFNGSAALTISEYAGELSELPDCGLQDGAARIRVTTTTETTTDSGTQRDSYVYRIGAFAAADKVYVQVDDSDAVYLTDTSNVAYLENATPGYLVDQFSNLVNIQRVDHIDVVMGDETWTMDIEHIQNEGETRATEYFTYNGTAVTDDKLFRKLYQELIGLTYSKLNDDYDYQAEPYMTVTYQLNCEPGELVIEYMEYDDDYLAVRRDDLTLFLIKREKIDALAEALRAFDEGTYVAKS